MINKNKIKILLIGTGSLKNYGCEAIVRGTYMLLCEKWPNAELHVGSVDIKYDEKIFADLKKIKFIKYKKRITPIRLLKGLMRRVGLGHGSPVRVNKHIVDSYDIFLSAGGDNFLETTEGGISTDLQDYMSLGERAKKMGVYYVLWGISAGPFSKRNKEVIMNNIKKADIVFPRERITFDYLQKQGILNNKMVFSADPAFYVDLDKVYNKSIQKIPDNTYIGLNISLLSLIHSFNDVEKGKKILYNALDKVLKNNESYRYICIPHVNIDNVDSQGDVAFMNEYMRCTKYKNKISCISFGMGMKRTKSIIADCDVLIAARMHCCVSGVTCGVPTIFLAYSEKGVGMSEYVYKDKSMVIQIKDLNENIIEQKVKSIVNSLDVKKRYLYDQKIRFKSDAEKSVNILKKRYNLR